MSVFFLNLEDQMRLFGIGEGDDRIDALVNVLPELKRVAVSDLRRISLLSFHIASHWAFGATR